MPQSMGMVPSSHHARARAQSRGKCPCPTGRSAARAPRSTARRRSRQNAPRSASSTTRPRRTPPRRYKWRSQRQCRSRGSEERTDGDAPASHWRRPTCQSCRLSLQRYDAPNYRLPAYPPKPASPNSWLGCTTAVTVIDQAISSLLISSRNTIISFGRTIAKSDEIHLMQSSPYWLSA